MFSRVLLRHLLFPASCGAVVYAKGREEDGETDLANKESGLKIRARELPLYVEDDIPKAVTISNKSETKTIVEETISCIRQEFQILVNQATVIKDEVDEASKKASVKTEETLRYLRTPENAVQRYGAVALGGSAGYILGLRKNLFKRLLYTAGGASLMAALCYPREAKEWSDELLVQVKKYFVIGYHFANGDQVDVERLDRDLRAGTKKGVQPGPSPPLSSSSSSSTKSSQPWCPPGSYNTPNCETSPPPLPPPPGSENRQCPIHAPTKRVCPIHRR